MHKLDLLGHIHVIEIAGCSRKSFALKMPRKIVLAVWMSSGRGAWSWSRKYWST